MDLETQQDQQKDKQLEKEPQNIQNDQQRYSDIDEDIGGDIPDIPELFTQTLASIDTVQRLKILLTFINYFTKLWAIYLVVSEYHDVFSKDTLLLFSYLLYALLEWVALGAALSIMLVAKFAKKVLNLSTYYIDNVGCLPILYSIFRFCFVVTFFVQSITLMIFSNFAGWYYPLVLVIKCFIFKFKVLSLLSLLLLQFFRIVMMCSKSLGYHQNWFDLECVFNSIAPANYRRAYSIVRTVIAEVYEFYTNLDPHIKMRVNQIRRYHKKTLELKENVKWITDNLSTTENTSKDPLLHKNQLPQIPEEPFEESKNGSINKSDKK